MNPLMTTVFYKPEFLIRAGAAGMVVAVKAAVPPAPVVLQRPVSSPRLLSA